MSALDFSSFSSIPSINTINEEFSVDDDQILMSSSSLNSLEYQKVLSCEEMMRMSETDSTKSEDKATQTDDDEKQEFVNKELNSQSTETDTDENSEDEPIEEMWTDSDSDDDEDIEVFLRLEPSITCLAFAAVLSSMTIGVIIVVEIAVFFTTSIILKG
jgi:hypothetical protein